MKLLKSFAFKNAIFYFFIFLLGLGTMGYLMLNNSSNRIIETAKNQLVHNGELIEIQLEDYIDGLLSQLDYLSNSPVLKKYISTEDSINYKLLLDNYLSVIRSNDDFFQIRFIEANSGREVIRVNQLNGKVESTKPNQLQYKSDRPYFKETIKLDSGEVYFSEINLNKEFGKISLPRTPTLRIACPLYFKSILKGIIVINTDLTKLFNRLENTVGAGFDLRMLNEKGFYLMHEEIDSTFIFEYGNDFPQFDLSPDDLIKDGIVSLPRELISVHKVQIKPMKYHFVFQVVANRSSLMKPYYDWRRKSFLLIFFTGLTFTIIAFYILRKQSQTFRRLTESMKQFSNNMNLEDLPTNREDEIGEMARSFKEMSALINQQISSIELEKKNAELAERDKSEFIENISHEIRNPLQSILGLSKMLEQNSPNPNQIDILRSIQLNTTNLVRLVNDILDYQSVINGNYKSEFLWEGIDNLLQDLLIGNQYSASQKSIQINTSLDSELKNYEFRVDKLRLSQILNNLISNALTHAAFNGSIITSVKLIQLKSDIARIAFSVSDDGIGMSESELLQINERYFSNKKSNSKESNFGLGLTIVNELLNHLGSELKASSQKNIGSTFYFELNFKYRSKEPEGPNINQGVNIDRNISVLLIDDDEQILNFYKHLFYDFKAVYISSFDQLNRNDDTLFDLIITDYRLGGNVVAEYISILKSIASNHSVLIVASGVDPDLKEIWKEFPQALAIQKPFEKNHLFNQINLGLVLSKYGVPQLNSIKADYDYDKDKYSKALTILIKEWEEYKLRLINCIEHKSLTDLEKILHKFNTTLRRLELPKLEKRLIKIKDAFSASHLILNKERNDINNIMECYHYNLKYSLKKIIS
ncbi:MAG: ATP-binding protein [Vicingaceae bacterium]